MRYNILRASNTNMFLAWYWNWVLCFGNFFAFVCLAYTRMGRSAWFYEHHSFIHSFFHSFVCSFIHLFIHTCTHKRLKF